MNKRILLALLAVTAIIVFLMWVHARKTKSKIISQEAPTEQRAHKLKSVQLNPQSLPAQQTLNDRAEHKRALLEQGNVPITFWGKVVNERGTGLPGVSIAYNIQRAGRLEASGMVSEDIIRTSTNSNTDGLFSILNERGTTLSIASITKDGYQLGENQSIVFGYFGSPSIHTPKESSPQMFIMRAHEDGGNISSISQEIKLPWDGRDFNVDLQTLKPSSSGDLAITAMRTAYTGRFGWKVTIKLNKGGLLEAFPGTAFIAPETGYSPIWECSYAAEAKAWRFSRETNVYYKWNEKFGRLKLRIYADAGPNDKSLYIQNFFNNSGERYTGGEK